MRDYRSLLAGDPCWDATTQARYERLGEAAQDRILQNREELLALCRFIEANRVRSYLEIGTWTGRLLSALHRLFAFDRVAACDDGYCRRFGFSHHFPRDARVFLGSSRDPAFEAFRASLGSVDLVLIDGDHGYRGVRADFEMQRRHPHRFLAFHDITGANRHTRGVARFWRELRGGSKVELVLPHRELGLPYSTMGIGIWSASGAFRLDGVLDGPPAWPPGGSAEP